MTRAQVEELSGLTQTNFTQSMEVIVDAIRTVIQSRDSLAQTKAPSPNQPEFVNESEQKETLGVVNEPQNEVGRFQ